jgi:long-chain acyl-CoA synthetase
MTRWDAQEALEIIQRDRVTTTHMVPANFQRILALPAETRDAYDLSSLKLVLHAAAPCPVPLKRAFMDFVGAEKVWEYYGASEGGGTVISPQEWLEHPGSVGKPFPGNEFVILDDDGAALRAGEVGTVWVNPAASSFEYHNDAEKTAASHRDRFFTVGDAGYLDADGYLYLTDRKSDMVITGGVNVYPREIEECLLGHDEIVDVATSAPGSSSWSTSCPGTPTARSASPSSARPTWPAGVDELHRAVRQERVRLSPPRSIGGRHLRGDARLRCGARSAAVSLMLGGSLLQHRKAAQPCDANKRSGDAPESGVFNTHPCSPRRSRSSSALHC